MVAMLAAGDRRELAGIVDAMLRTRGIGRPESRSWAWLMRDWREQPEQLRLDDSGGGRES